MSCPDLPTFSSWTSLFSMCSSMPFKNVVLIPQSVAYSWPLAFASSHWECDLSLKIYDLHLAKFITLCCCLEPFSIWLCLTRVHSLSYHKCRLVDFKQTQQAWAFTEAVHPFKGNATSLIETGVRQLWYSSKEKTWLKSITNALNITAFWNCLEDSLPWTFINLGNMQRNQ